MTPGAIIRQGDPAPCHPWPRHVLTQAAWQAMAAGLGQEPGLVLLGMWADTVQVHALFHAGAPLLASVTVEAGLYAALSPARPAAASMERAIADLWGHQAADGLDTRPWLDHGAWTTLRPLSDRPVPNAGAPEVPEMHVPPGDVLGFGPLPPVFAGPAHWRLGVAGDSVTAMEARLGYAHRGVLGLMRGKSPPGAARLAGRIDGAAAVAHATAFARAVEAALQLEVPPRAVGLRVAMLVLERVAVGLHDVHATAAALGLETEAMVAREGLLAACEAAFGHRLMLDLVRPGGVDGTLTPAGVEVLDAALAAADPLMLPRWPPGLGVLPIEAALRYQPGGIAGRSAGVPDPLAPAAPVTSGGDLVARMSMRTEALARDIARARESLAALPEGQAWVAPGHETAEGLGVAQGPQGRVWHWVRLAGGVVAACAVIDPAWSILPAFERAAVGATLETLPAIAASFGLRVPGMDL